MKYGNIAVIDTETNYYDEVISLGIVIIDELTYEIKDKLYMIVYPECTKPAMFSDELYHPNVTVDLQGNRKEVITKLKELLDKYKVNNIFAYNARFDKYHLPELFLYDWYDIMKIAAYKQFNPSISNCEEIYSTGRLKRGFGLDCILKRLRKMYNRDDYSEIHNALTDAIDEAEVMELLGHDVSVYYRCSKV